MTTHARMSSAMVRALVEAAQAAGVAPSMLAARAQIDVARMADPYAWFPLDEFDGFVACAVELTHDPAFGLHWGERSPLMQFDLASALTATAPSLRSAVLLAVRVQPLFVSHPALTFVEQGGRAACVSHVHAGTELGLRAGTELSLASIARLVRYCQPDAIRRVNIAYGPPPYASEYERVLGPGVCFAQAESSIELDVTDLDRPLLHRNAALHEDLVARTEQVRGQVLGSMTLAERVVQHVRWGLPTLPRAGEAARALTLSERSLRRRLAEEGTSYRALVDGVQRARAEELSASGHKTQKELAAALGFDSVSGFQRAAARWRDDAAEGRKAPPSRAPDDARDAWEWPRTRLHGRGRSVSGRDA